MADESGTESLPRSKQTPLTKTCQNCATAKVKCTRNGDAQKCHRCERLGKPCEYRQARRRFFGNRKDQRIETLEARLTMLEDRRGPYESPPNPSSSSSNTRGSSQRHTATPETSHDNSWARDTEFYALASTKDEDIIDRGLISLESAEELLAHFRAAMIYHFPFVIPPPFQTADDLRREYPYLFLAIMTVSSYQNMPLQRQLGHMMYHRVAYRLICKNEVSFDLLQAILVFVAWCQYHPRPRRHSQLLLLAISIISDLRLNLPSDAWEWQNTNVFHPDSFGTPRRPADSARRDRKRAFIGCYYVASSTSILWRKLNVMPFSAQVQKYCEDLYNEPEYPTDKYLSSIIKLQHIWEKVNLLPIKNEGDLPDAGSSIRMQIKMLKIELDVFRDTLPFPFRELALLEAQYYTTQLYIDQISLQARNYTFPIAQISTEPWYSDLLRSGLLTANTFFRNYLGAPLHAEKLFNNTEIAQVGLFLIVTPKLVVTAADHMATPDVLAIIQDLDIGNIINQVMARIEAYVTEDRDLEGDRDVQFQFLKRVKGVKEWFDRRPRLSGQTSTAPDDSSLIPGVFDAGTHGQILSTTSQIPSILETGPIPDAELEQMVAEWYSYPMQTF